MKSLSRSLLLIAVLLSTALPLLAAPKTEVELIAALDSPKEKVVYAALQDLGAADQHTESGREPRQYGGAETEGFLPAQAAQASGNSLVDVGPHARAIPGGE